MKQLLITGPRQAAFEDVPIPTCPRDGLLVQACVTAVSTGTEIRVYRAQPVDDAGKFLHETVPFVLPAENGYSFVGRVQDVGPDVSRFSVGDRVFATAPHCEIAVVEATAAVRLPDDIPDEQSVFLNIVEVAHIALRRGQPDPGGTVAIVGQGVIGLSAVALCQAFGLRTVAVDLNPRRLETARRMGADLAISPRDANFHETITAFSNGGCDVVLEATSNWQGVKTAMEIARPEANVVIVSRHTQTPHFNPVGHPFLGKKLNLLTSYGYPPAGQRWDRARSVALTLELFSQGRLDITPMITDRLSWEALPDVYARYDAGDADLIGTVLRWPGDVMT